MTEYHIEVSEPAEAEIDTAYYYLLLRSPQAANRLRQGIAKAIRSLTQMPSRCPLAPENGRLDRPIRQLLHRYGSTTYRILFFVVEATETDTGIVRIIRVLHGAQQHLGSATDQADDNSS